MIKLIFILQFIHTWAYADVFQLRFQGLFCEFDSQKGHVFSSVGTDLELLKNVKQYLHQNGTDNCTIGGEKISDIDKSVGFLIERLQAPDNTSIVVRRFVSVDSVSGTKVKYAHGPCIRSSASPILESVDGMLVFSSMVEYLNGDVDFNSADYARVVSEWPEDIRIWDYLQSIDARDRFVKYIFYHYDKEGKASTLDKYDAMGNACTGFSVQFLARYSNNVQFDEKQKIALGKNGIRFDGIPEKLKMPVILMENGFYGSHMWNGVLLDPDHPEKIESYGMVDNTNSHYFRPTFNNPWKDGTLISKDGTVDERYNYPSLTDATFGVYGAKLITLDKVIAKKSGVSLSFSSTTGKGEKPSFILDHKEQKIIPVSEVAMGLYGLLHTPAYFNQTAWDHYITNGAGSFTKFVQLEYAGLPRKQFQQLAEEVGRLGLKLPLERGGPFVEITPEVIMSLRYPRKSQQDSHDE